MSKFSRSSHTFFRCKSSSNFFWCFLITLLRRSIFYSTSLVNSACAFVSILIFLRWRRSLRFGCFSVGGSSYEILEALRRFKIR